MEDKDKDQLTLDFDTEMGKKWVLDDSNIKIVAGATFTCRWCGMPNSNRPEMRCRECGAVNGITLCFNDWDPKGGHSVKVYHNPDNSLYIDFIKPGGKTVRYSLDPAILKQLGQLVEFNEDPQGKRTPQT